MGILYHEGPLMIQDQLDDLLTSIIKWQDSSMVKGWHLWMCILNQILCYLF